MTRFIATTLIASGLTASLLGGCGLQFGTKKGDDKPSSSPSMGGAGGAPSDTAMGGETGMGGEMTTEPEPCEPRPNELDVPDDDFNDSNCDGIDGTIARGIFVSPNGSDDGEGTIDDPVATIREGIARGAETRRAVYVCNATYEEKVRVESDAADVFGGYDCEDWRRSTDRPTILSNDGEPALIIANVDDMLIDGFVIQSSDATEPSGSSIAAAVNESEGVVFKNVEIVAGSGANGADGADGAHQLGRANKGADGGAAGDQFCSSDCRGVGGARTDLGGACPDGVTVSWYGGNGGWGAAASDEPTFTRGGTRESRNGGDGGDVRSEDGSPGTDGLPGADGAAASQSTGTVVALSYVPPEPGTAGEYGGLGTPGGGGAGGGRRYDGTQWTPGGGGGQGGYEGCGGRPGLGGTSGGASVGLLLVASSVEIRNATVLAANGGNGGRGGAGAAGRLGGRGGTGGDGGTVGGRGGDGGNGGRGGHGGAGAGGPSFGIAQADGASFTQFGGQVLGGEGGRGGTAENENLVGVDSFEVASFRFPED